MQIYAGFFRAVPPVIESYEIPILILMYANFSHPACRILFGILQDSTGKRSVMQMRS